MDHPVISYSQEPSAVARIKNALQGELRNFVGLEVLSFGVTAAIGFFVVDAHLYREAKGWVIAACAILAIEAAVRCLGVKSWRMWLYFLGVVLLFGYLAYHLIGVVGVFEKEYAEEHKPVTPPPQAPPKVEAPKPPKPKVASGPPHPTPCSLKGGTYYAEPRMMPGGERYERPALQLEMEDWGGWSVTNDEYLVIFEFTLTSRGEASITKNWQLCWVIDGKPVRFSVGRIPDGGIKFNDGTMVTREKSLPDNTVKEPIPHGHVEHGFAAFRIPKEVGLTRKDKPLPEGSISFQDYLAHTYSWDTIPDPNPPKKSYVPGTN
jgi:hypothetical protein